MRITTQMVNESARKAGLPINNVSLLNYVQGNGNNTSLLQALNKSKEASTDTTKKSSYENLDKEAGQLTKSAEVLLQDGENNLFEQAKASGDNQKIYDSIETFIADYNSTIKALQTTSNTMNDFYSEMLLDAKSEIKESLKNIGITFEKDGTATVDMEKEKAADVETLEKVFGKDSDFVKKVKLLSTSISDYAKASVKSLGNVYNSNGGLYSTTESSKYDYWG